MSERVLSPAAGRAPLGLPGEPRELSARAATLVLRVADLLEATCTAESGAPAAAAFLRSYADAVTTGASADRASAPSPVDALATRFALSDDELTLLMLAGLPDEHEGLAATFRQFHPYGEPHPTLGLAALLLRHDLAGRSSLRRLVDEGPALRHGLVRLTGDRPLYDRSLLVAPALWEALHGIDAWPAGLRRRHVPEAATGVTGWLSLPAVRRARAALDSAEDRTLLLTGDDDQIALGRCGALSAAAGRRAVAAVAAADDDAGIALLVAHAAARRAVPVLVLPRRQGEAPCPVLDLGTIPGPVLLCAGEGDARPTGTRPVLAVPTGPVGILDRRRAWRESLPDLGEHAPELAARHPLDPVLTAQVAADVRSSQRLAGGLHGLPEVCGVIRSRAAVALPSGTRLVTPAASWERLVLGEQAARQLRDAVDRLDRQAQVLDEWRFEEQARADRGVRLLFAGPPGTGKSLAAEVVAAGAETDLLVVDVSRIVSKWVGETEKNLAEVFDAAERTRAVLLLDEADALFGARTEISDAHDRYANVETAYLLQRLDRFDGLAVLATNFLQNVDPAFLRRMHFVVRFEPPDELERERMWALHLPRHAPLGDDIDLAVLARLYPIPGAWIRNAAVGAAFLAAGEGTTVAQRHLTWAVRREYEKTARPYPGDPIASRRPLRDGGTKETA